MLKRENCPRFITPNRSNPHLPLFVFLPGLDGTGQLLHTQTATLEKVFDVRSLVIPADALTSWDSLSQQVMNLIEVERCKQPKRKIYLCGESFGGCLAIKVALRSQRLFHRIILVNPASCFHQKPLIGGALQLAQFIPDLFYQVGTYGVLPFLGALERMEKRDRDHLLKAMKSVPPETFQWRLSLLHKFKVSPGEFERLKQPVLLIAGTADRIINSVAEVHRLSRFLPNTKTVLLPNSGHACLLEREVDLSKLLHRYNFLDRYLSPKINKSATLTYI